MLDLTAENWSFSPAEVRVREGEHVTLRIVSLSETHSFAVPALGIDLPLYPGEPVTVDLPTDVPGTYDFFCSIPCGSGHEDMRGTIVVEEQD